MQFEFQTYSMKQHFLYTKLVRLWYYQEHSIGHVYSRLQAVQYDTCTILA